MDNETVTARPKDRAELLDRIEREWSALLQTVGKLSPEQMTTPDAGEWSPKDNLAHLTAWEQFMLHHYLEGQPPHQVMQIDQAAFERLDEDALNAVLFERNRHRTVEDVLGDLQRSHAQVLAALEHMTFADLKRQRFLDDPQGRPLLDWVIGNTNEHYREHRRVIEAALGA